MNDLCGRHVKSFLPKRPRFFGRLLVIGCSRNQGRDGGRSGNAGSPVPGARRGPGKSRRASQEGGRDQAPRGYLPEDLPKRRNRPSGCNQAVKQGRLKKQRTRESGGDISAQRTQPPRLRLQSRVERFETENRQRGEEMAQAFVNTTETTRPRRCCPTGSGVNGRPPKLADGNMAPHMILSPEPFSVRQS